MKTLEKQFTRKDFLEAKQSKEEREANAKLMAAAPVLLEALIKITEVSDTSVMSRQELEVYEICIKAINKAIKK